jgi:MFS family permease
VTGGPRRWAEQRRALLSRWALVSAATLLYWVVTQAVRPFVALRLQDLGADDLTIGVALAGASVGGLLLAIPSGRLLDRLPQREVQVGALLGLAATTAGLALTGSVAALVAMMIGNGVFAMWVWLAQQSIITHAGSGAFRDRQLGLFSLAWGIGLAAGPSVGAVAYDRAGFGALCAVCTALCLAATAAAAGAPPVAASPRAEATEDTFRGSLGRSFANPVLVGVLLASFVNIYVQSLRVSFYPVYLERAGVGVARIGLLLSLIGVSSLLVRAVLPAATRRFGEFGLLLWSTWVAIVGVVLTPFAPQFAVLVLGALLIGVGLGANPPITVSLVAHHSEAHERGLAVGLRMVANRSAQVAQPLVFGGVASVVGLALAFPVSAALLAGLTLWMGLRLRRVR